MRKCDDAVVERSNYRTYVPLEAARSCASNKFFMQPVKRSTRSTNDVHYDYPMFKMKKKTFIDVSIVVTLSKWLLCFIYQLASCNGINWKSQLFSDRKMRTSKLWSLFLRTPSNNAAGRLTYDERQPACRGPWIPKQYSPLQHDEFLGQHITIRLVF